MSSADARKSRWALSQGEIAVYAVVMLLAVLAPFSGLILEVGFGGAPVDLRPLLAPLAAVVLGLAYLGQRRRRAAEDDRADEFFSR